ncbi:hypothetical protein GGR53DRAFT_463686 [Hypoxylon sp. FL1150]|nr:hypothetical protein GGR53DRAFT_463686 [Hypoxylon sp. FL1150]
MFTIVSIAQSCLTETWGSLGQSTGTAVVLGNPYNTDCWNSNQNLSTTISPAVCPFGYTSACDASPRSDGETVWACCPTGFTCDGGFWSCLGDREIGSTKTYNVTMADTLGSTITTQKLETGGVNAHSIRVAFRSSDFAMMPLPAASSDQATSTTTPTPTSDADVTTSGTGSLSMGATIGVGIGVGAAVLLLGVAGLAWRQYRRNKQVAAVEEDVCHPVPNGDTSQARMALSSTPMSEMDGAPGLFELETKAGRRSHH